MRILKALISEDKRMALLASNHSLYLLLVALFDSGEQLLGSILTKSGALLDTRTAVILLK